ncbi:radical SAM/SPASM domain-containing protein [Altericista sp. CCNU0014]|uniref:radical SAM protein n=1 Tax=Altericista sp. CCNU0014 TaxID=3082949 RepID=UPI00384AAB35
MLLKEVIQELPSIARDVYENHVTKNFKVLSPTVLHVNVNLRCNTKCAMCNIWELKSPHVLDLDQLGKIFSDSIYRRVEYIILAGGEPTLRKDLAEVVELMHGSMPKLKKLMIASNAIDRASVQKQYPRIARYCAEHSIRLTLGVSLDGVGDLHDKVRGVPGAFEKVMENVRFLKDLQKDVPFNMSLDPTIFSMNVREMQQLQDLADRLKLPITFQFAAVADDYYHNSNLEQVLSIDETGRKGMIAFLKQKVKEASLFDALACYYAEVIRRAEGATHRRLPCPFVNQGLLLNPDGTLQYCHNSQPIGNTLETPSTEIYHSAQNQAYRSTFEQTRCPDCQMSCLFFVTLRKEIFPFLWFVAKRSLGFSPWR